MNKDLLVKLVQKEILVLRANKVLREIQVKLVQQVLRVHKEKLAQLVLLVPLALLVNIQQAKE